MKKPIEGTLCDTDRSKLIAAIAIGKGWPDEFGKKLYRTVLHRFFVYEYYGGRKPTIELIHRGEAIDLYRLWEAMDPYKFLLDKRFDFEDAFEDSN